MAVPQHAKILSLNTMHARDDEQRGRYGDEKKKHDARRCMLHEFVR